MKEKIIELRKQGCSYKEIQEQLGCSKSTINFHCSKMLNHKSIVKEKTKNENDKRKKDSKQKKKTNKRVKKTKTVTLDKDLSEIDKIAIELYSVNGLSTNLIADIFNLELKVVREICYKNAKRKFCNKYAYEQIKNYRQKMKLAAILYKGSKCQKCGYNDNISALEFHHENPNEKEFGISASHVAWEKMKKELDKCILLCSNCHREEHNKNMDLKILRAVADWEAHS